MNEHHVYIEVKGRKHKEFVDALERLCQKYAKNNNYYFKFEA